MKNKIKKITSLLVAAALSLLFVMSSFADKLQDDTVFYKEGIMTDEKLSFEIPEGEEVTLVLSGTEISCEDGPCIEAYGGGTLVIVLPENTVNTVTSGNENDKELNSQNEELKKGVISAEGDIVITGDGRLNVNGYIKNGIHAGGDVVIESGTIYLDTARKGIKSKGNVHVEGGTIIAKCLDDGINADADVEITGGIFSIKSGDDAVHADENIRISGGTINISGCYEGIEGHTIDISGGMFNIMASDDGLNTGGAIDREDLPWVHISGGDIYISVEDGDGIDSNGDLYVSGGTLVIDGSETQWDAALDYGGEYGGTILIDGGFVFAAGNANMAGQFTGESSQCSVQFIVTRCVYAGSVVEVLDSAGNVLCSHKVLKTADSFVFSCEELCLGKKYVLKIDDLEYDFLMEKVSQSVTVS